VACETLAGVTRRQARDLLGPPDSTVAEAAGFRHAPFRLCLAGLGCHNGSPGMALDPAPRRRSRRLNRHNGH
jgi:hypothetical protein